jgi:hypothetical protein
MFNKTEHHLKFPPPWEGARGRSPQQHRTPFKIPPSLGGGQGEVHLNKTEHHLKSPLLGRGPGGGRPVGQSSLSREKSIA